MPLEAEGCLDRLTRKLAEATIWLVAMLEEQLKLLVAKDKTFKLTSDSAVLKLLDEALPGLGTPQSVVKRLGQSLPVHLRRIKTGVKRTKVICKYRRHPGALHILHSGDEAGCTLRC